MNFGESVSVHGLLLPTSGCRQMCMSMRYNPPSCSVESNLI